MTRAPLAPTLKKTRIHLLNFAFLLPIISTPLSHQPILSPEIHNFTENANHLLARQIYTLLDTYRLRYDIDATSVTNETLCSEELQGQEAYIEKILAIVQSNQPLTFKLVGFPYKSLNKDLKVFNNLPDMAERKAFEQLNALCAQIKEIYAPGAHLIIISDGHIFCDVFQISDAEVDAYEEGLNELMVDLPHLSLVTVKDLMEKPMTYDQFRQTLDKLSPSQDHFVKTLLADENAHHGFDVMKKRLHLDLNCPSGISLLRISSLDHIAQTVMGRSSRFSTYISQQKSLASSLNLSVHFQKNVSKKMGIHLVGSSVITPWHGVLVADKDGQFAVKHRQDINPQNYVVINEWVNGVACPYYRHL